MEKYNAVGTFIGDKLLYLSRLYPETKLRLGFPTPQLKSSRPISTFEA